MSQPESIAKQLGASLPPSLTDEGEPVFAEPWQAQAFSMTVSLFEQGLFSWSDWTETFSSKCAERAAEGATLESTLYYQNWLSALETLVSERAGIGPSALADLKERWELAYRSTPHGEKVAL